MGKPDTKNKDDYSPDKRERIFNNQGNYGENLLQKIRMFLHLIKEKGFLIIRATIGKNQYKT